jgi:hypothetical protein
VKGGEARIIIAAPHRSQARLITLLLRDAGSMARSSPAPSSSSRAPGPTEERLPAVRAEELAIGDNEQPVPRSGQADVELAARAVVPLRGE